MKFLILFFILCSNLYADGMAGLNYTVYAAGGATPTMTTNRTVLATGVTTSLDYNWGSGVVMNSGRSDGVIIHFTGNVLWPGVNGSGNKSITFYDRSDDGFYMTINNTLVINNWKEQGPANYNSSGTLSLTAGQVYAIDIWYYENGGGAVVQLNWNIGNGIVVIPTANLGTLPTFFAPVLCCGGSSASFVANAIDVANLQTFINRSTADSEVYIKQIGTSNTITVNQTGTKNNYAKYIGNGSNNNVSINESATNSAASNYSTLNIVGNNNSTSIIQQNSGTGSKQVSSNIIGDNSSLIINQSGTGSQYIETTLNGNSKHVDISQVGAGNHMANVTLSGTPVDLSLTQSGNLQQSFSIDFNSTAVGGSPKITVQQGP